MEMPANVLKELHREARSNVPALLFNLVAVFAAGFSLATGWPTGHWGWIVFMTVWLAYFQHCWTLIFHEDAHYTLYKARWHNILNGTIVGTLLMVPFNVYRQVHIRHHNRMNSPEDFELWPYTDPTLSVSFRRAFVAFDILLGLWAGPYIYGRMYFVKDSPIKDPGVRRRIALEYALIVVFWSSLLAAVALNGWWREFALVYLIPAWLTGVFQTLRKLTEHLGLPAGDPMHGARTILAQDWVGRFAAWTSFHVEQHGLHHKYPQMPHGNLERAIEATETRVGAPVFPTYWSAMCDMFPHLARPGIGVNAWDRRAGRDLVGSGASPESN